MNRPAALVAVLIGLLLISACSERRDAPTPTPTVTATAENGSTTAATSTATAAPAASPAATPVVRQLTVRPPQGPAGGSQVFIVTGCTACDGPDESLQLHETGPPGVTTVKTVLGPGHPALEGMTIGQIDAAADGTVLAATACRSAYCGGLGNHPIDDWRVLVSVNDGVDWTVAYEETIHYVGLADVTVEGVIVSSVRAGVAVPSPVTYTVANLAKQKRVVTPPAVAGALPWPVLLPAGRVAWIGYPGPQGGDRRKVYREDGTEIPLRLPAAATITGVQATLDGRLAVSLLAPGRFLAIFPAGGGTALQLIDLGETEVVGVSSDGNRAVGNNFVSGAGPHQLAPIAFDFGALTATPLTTEVLRVQPGRNRFVGYDRVISSSAP